MQVASTTTKATDPRMPTSVILDLALKALAHAYNCVRRHIQ